MSSSSPRRAYILETPVVLVNLIPGPRSVSDLLSSPRSNILNVLPTDVLCKIMDFLPGQYRYIAGSCRGFRDAYTRQHPGKLETTQESTVGSIQTAELYVSDMLSNIQTSPRPKYYEIFYYSKDIAVWASQYGRLDILKWVNNTNRAFLHSDRHTMFHRAAEGGHIECFQFLNKVNAAGRVHNTIDKSMYLEAAARRGQLAFLQHFYKEGYCFTSTCYCHAAAANGHVHVLQFLHEVAKAPWRKDTICANAAHAGHTECLIYLHTHGARLSPHHVKYPAYFGYVDCLRYIIDSYDGDWGGDSQASILKDALKSAATRGCLDSLSFLLELETVNWKNSDVCMAFATSAEYSRRDCLAYLIEHHGFEIGNLALGRALVTTAGEYVDFGCFAYLLDLGCTWSRLVMEETLLAVACGAMRPHLTDKLEYLLDKDYDWDSVIIHQAVEKVVRRKHVDRLGHLLKVDGVDWDRERLSQIQEEAERDGAVDCSGCLVAFLATYGAADSQLETMDR